MLRSLLLAGSRNRWLRRQAESSGWAGRQARRFVAGRTLAEAVAAVRALNRQGLAASFGPLGENVGTPAAARQAAAEAMAVLAAIERDRLDANLSVKLTHLGLDLDPDLTARRLREIARRAARIPTLVRVDMEGSAYTDRTLALVEQLHAEGFPVGVVLQACLRRTPADLDRLTRLAIPLRLVKGAYREPFALAYLRRPAVDAAFALLQRRLLQAGDAAGVTHAIATHDPRLLAAAETEARRLNLRGAGVEFQFLYGIRRDLQKDLHAAGWRVRIYVPFGVDWYPYLMRRLAERPANVLFLLRNLGH